MGNWYRKISASAGFGSEKAVVGHNKGARRRRNTRALTRSARFVVEHLESRQLLTGAPGTLDPTFGGTGLVYGASLHPGVFPGHNIALQSDGKIVQVQTSMPSAYGTDDYYVTRYTAQGALDTTFGTGGSVYTDFDGYDDWGQSVAIQSNGKIVVAGDSTFFNGTTVIGGIGVVRYNTDGSLDTTFGTGGKAEIDTGGTSGTLKILIQSDGKIVLAGGNIHFAVVRLTTSGALDPTFGTGGIANTTLTYNSDDFIRGMTFLPNGDILAVGDDNTPAQMTAAAVCYTPAGTLDTSFNGTGIFDEQLGGETSYFTGAAVQSDGKIVVSGYTDLLQPGMIVRFNTDGTLDTTFNSTGVLLISGPGACTDIAVQNDGQIVASLLARMAVVRVSPSGTIDTTFGTGGLATDMVVGPTIFNNAMLLTPDGDVLVGASNIGTQYLAKYFITTAPTANANGGYTVNTQASINLSASGSTDPYGEALTYAWDVNYNGTTFNPTLSGISPTFSAVGISGTVTHTVALVVTNINGAASPIVTASLKIANVPPTLTTSASANTVNEATPVTFTGTISDVDPTDAYTYDWHVTDTNGQVVADGTTLAWGFTPASVGTYTCKLTATDAFGAAVTSTQTITALHVAPAVSISGATPYASRGDLFTLNLSAVEVGYETITSWVVNWGDGNTQTITGNPGTFTHTYLSAATNTVSASATDAYGTTSASSISVGVGAGIYYDLAAANHSAQASINNAAAGNVVDNNGSTEWTSGNVSSSPSQWVYVDLGGVYNINDIKLNWDTAYAGTYKIRISNDSCNWNDLSTIQSGAAGLVDVGGLNGTGRYLLVQMISLSSGNTGYALKDVYAYGSDDLATNRTVYASSNQSTVANTLDTSNSTVWTSTNAANQWVFMDLGEVYNIRTVKVNFAGDYPVQYSIYTSSDTTSWTQISNSPYATAGLNTISGLSGNGRYVMISMPTCANGTDIKISDLEVNGTYNLALGRPVTVSTNPSTAANAVDGNTSTGWSSSTTGTQSIYTDLGAGFNVTRVTLNWGSNYPSAFQIQVSSDASTWTNIYSTTTFAGGTSDLGLIYGNGRYVRVLMTAGSGSNYTLNEFTVYCSANLALMRPMTASTNATGHGAPYASDQDPTTSWQSTAAGTQSITTDLGTSFSVTNVTINFDAAYASNYTVSISNDNATWTTLYTMTAGHAGINQIAGLSGAGRYVKVTMTSGSSGYYQIDDLYIFGH